MPVVGTHVMPCLLESKILWKYCKNESIARCSMYGTYGCLYTVVSSTDAWNTE